MNKVCIQNLGMITTNRCNLDCGHCMRGCKNNKEMSKEVIDATLDQTIAIGNLSICGGEPTMALDTLEYLFNQVIEKKIIVDGVFTVINGSIYSERFVELMKKIDEYVSIFRKKSTTFNISCDKYHLEELKKLGLVDLYCENLEKYKESKQFGGVNLLDSRLKLFREGNACNLDESLTVKLRPMNLYIAYPEEKICNIGPLVTINADGIITECDASFENQEKIYNYGNVLTDSLERIALERGTILTPREWDEETIKEMKKQMTYNDY